jgi:hypothetical protein
MILEVVALSLLLAGNLLVLRWLLVSDPVGEAEARDAEGLPGGRTEPAHFRRAA